MKEDELKKKIRKNIKENIAISNLKEEIYMNRQKNRKIMYGVLASCAVFAIGAGIVINKLPLEKNDGSILQAKVEKEDMSEKKEKLKTDININKVDMKASKDYMMSAQTRKVDQEVVLVDLKFVIEANVPDDFEEEYSVVGLYINRKEGKEDGVLQNYEFRYKNKAGTRTITLGVGFNDKKPLRDYYFLDVEKISKIGDVELTITQYEDSYLVVFSDKDVNYDIETNGITQDELVEFLTSLIENNRSYHEMIAKDKDSNVKENVKDNLNIAYPNYYAGKYVDNEGNNVVLVKEDTKENRGEICQLLGITENKTKFEIGKYSYEYLIGLQNQISQKMQNKELPFVISSSIMEDKNWIQIEVTTNKEDELKKIRQLDAIGGAIVTKYSKEGTAKKDILKEKK